MGVSIEPAEYGCPAGRAQGCGTEMIFEQGSLICQRSILESLSAGAPYSLKHLLADHPSE